MLGVAGSEDGLAGDVAALLADLGDVAADDVVDAVGVAMSPATFMADAFNLNVDALGPDEPLLNAKTSVGITGSDGVVRRIRELASGC